MGAVKSPANAAASQSKVYLTPSISNVLPYAIGHPLSAWKGPIIQHDEPAGHTEKKSALKRNESISTNFSNLKKSLKDDYNISLQRTLEGWKVTRTSSGLPGKRIWVDAKGEQVANVYKVGWERQVLDLEARLHETLFEISGNRHTFTIFEKHPKSVLDVGTGSGLWPISQAIAWPNASIVGLDLVRCQVDLSRLATAERTARRSTTTESEQDQGLWESIEDRITWQRADFLHGLPYDSGDRKSVV